MIIVIYMVLGYWAVGRTLFKNKVLIGTWSAIFLEKVIFGFLLGFVLIPVAVIKLLTSGSGR